MLLPSKLGSTTLGDLLGSLHRHRVSGILELTEPGGTRHRIHLHRGDVTEVETPGPRLGDILESLESMDSERVRELRRRVLGEMSQPLGCELLEQRLVTSEELLEALGRQNKQRLERLFRIPQANLCFRTAKPTGLPTATLNARDFLHGRPRLRDRLRQRQASDPKRLDSVSLADDQRTQALRALGLPNDASRESIVAAFRRQASRVHPDRNSERSYAERAEMIREFARLSAAYHTLVA